MQGIVHRAIDAYVSNRPIVWGGRPEATPGLRRGLPQISSSSKTSRVAPPVAKFATSAAAAAPWGDPRPCCSSSIVPQVKVATR